MYFLGLHNLIERVNISKLAVRVVSTVTMVFLSNLSEVLQLGSVLLHVFFARIAEQFGRYRGLRRTPQFLVFRSELF